MPLSVRLAFTSYHVSGVALNCWLDSDSNAKALWTFGQHKAVQTVYGHTRV